ncbi:hypothetical protein [Fulvivirga lutea]|uniref:Response regulatory domain-containing protein n=1 Tax=Fulvivirga lutea TaxID=2810512 RepID=A0A975A1E4_9BACT|nr:hypothetical protein [Fulvivirga lutea]QSE98155.1 hypothetical protein JR347_03470 [Fulvivirga lutea]
MEALSQNQPSSPINVFLIGNNPIELSSVYTQLKQIKSSVVNAEIGFELSGLFRKIRKFKPSCILIDDNVEKIKIKKILKKLTQNSDTRDIPITVLKNSNYSEGYSEAQDYLLKENLTSEKLSRSILNSIRFKKMHLYMIKKYRKNKSRLLDLVKF